MRTPSGRSCFKFLWRGVFCFVTAEVFLCPITRVLKRLGLSSLSVTWQILVGFLGAGVNGTRGFWLLANQIASERRIVAHVCRKRVTWSRPTPEYCRL